MKRLLRRIRILFKISGFINPYQFNQYCLGSPSLNYWDLLRNCRSGLFQDFSQKCLRITFKNYFSDKSQHFFLTSFRKHEKFVKDVHMDFIHVSDESQKFFLRIFTEISSKTLVPIASKLCSNFWWKFCRNLRWTLDMIPKSRKSRGKFFR